MTKLIRIDGMIGHGEGEITVEDIRAQLPANGTDPIDVRIHSEGGEVFEGFAIYDALKAYKGPKRCVVESSAFSIASFITMAFDEIEITPNGYMMLHNPRLEASGDDEELAKHSEMLAQLKTSMIRVYAERTGKSEEEIAQWLKRESYLNADDAVANGFATRIVGEPVVGRVFARVKDMPHGVVTALFGAGSGGDKREPTKENNSMSDSQPAIATIQDIRAVWPKAKADFIVKCLEHHMPVASVASAAIEEMMAENEALRAKATALEEELAALKAQAQDEELQEEEEVEAKAQARSGVTPVAVARGTAMRSSATAKWREVVDGYVAKGMPKAKAVQQANRSHGDLRIAMLEEANAVR
jgi:ATP-dependent protease ClpP protease subunit